MRRREFVKTFGAGVSGAFLPRPLLPRLRVERFVERWSWAMGQAVHVMVFAESEDQGLEACAAALAELRRVEARLSVFDDASDLCELNRRAGRRPMRTDADLTAVLAAAVQYEKHSSGAFNAAVEPLMRVWGFHRPRRDLPNARELAEAREAVATAVVRVTPDGTSLPNAHTRLDFGGIAVGWGLDRAVAVLRTAGIQRAFIDISGDCYGLGTPPDEPEGWKVQLAGSSRVVRLHDAALATSSNTQSVIQLGGYVLGHVMNPVTGQPVETRRQVTIVAGVAWLADAMSTAALVSGESDRMATAMYITE